MRLRLSPFVRQDLEEIAAYIAEDSPRQAADWIRTLRSHFSAIAEHPLLYRLRPKLGAEARMVAVGQYVILFRVREESVRIERVVHGSRDLLPLFKEVQD